MNVLTGTVATSFGGTLRVIQIGIRARLAIFLGSALQSFALLDSDLVRGFGAGYGNFEVALSSRFTGVSRLIGYVIRIVVGLCIGHILLRIRHFFLCVRLRIRHIALRFGTRLGDVVLNIGWRFCLVAARHRETGGENHQIRNIGLHVSTLLKLSVLVVTTHLPAKSSCESTGSPPRPNRLAVCGFRVDNVPM
jgi:hypothetical protein